VDEDNKPLTKGGDNYEVLITDPNGDAVPARIVDNNDGTYSAQYKPNVVGPHTVQVNLLQDGEAKPIKDMPVTTDIRKGACSRRSYMSGKGMKWGYEGRRNEFTIHCFDEDGQPVAGEQIELLMLLKEVYDDKSVASKVIRYKDSVEYRDHAVFENLEDEHVVDASTLNAKAIINPTITDLKNGQYSVVYQPNITGAHMIDCRLADAHIRKSPAELSIYFNCEHKGCTDAMAVLHKEIMDYEQQNDAEQDAEAAQSELKTLRALLSSPDQNTSSEEADELRQQIEAEQIARAAAEEELANLRARLAELG
jgi:hypothetical protein